MSYRIFFFRGGLLEDTAEVATEDLVEAAKVASSQHADLTAEIWQADQKVAICRPSWEHRTHSVQGRLIQTVAVPPQAS